MRKVLSVLLIVLLPVLAAPAFAEQQPAPAPSTPAEPDTFELYTATVDPATASALRQRYDHDVLAAEPGDGDEVKVSVILSPVDAAKLRDQGVAVRLKRNNKGQTLTEAFSAKVAAGNTVYRSYSEPGGIEDELRQIARDHPRQTKLVKMGESIQGQDILAIKVTRNARNVRDGRRPASMYLGTQHAREWISPEFVRRLLHYFLDNYRGDRELRRLINRNEYWFAPVVNPDGYDYTFTEGNRLWRKNLRDNDGDGTITASADGVDLNRNFPTNWGYDNEGSSPELSSQTYRGAGPASEPETTAQDRLFRRIGFNFLLNYHSAAELLLYGVGWQVETPTPDDLIYEALAGDDQDPAVPGYDPDLSAELYTTNGETLDHAQTAHDILGFTPEMSTCQTVSENPGECDSVFNFPDDEALIQEEFDKNLPFALDIAKSTPDPDEPVSYLGNEAEDWLVDDFEVSFGSPQTVATVAARQLGRIGMRYRINGGRIKRTGALNEWEGGEHYGDTHDVYYREVRGKVRGADPGDEVTVWFRGFRRGRSPDFTYTVRSDSNADVLVVAAEDYTGASPTQEGGPNYLDAYTQALEDNGISHDVYDFDAEGRQVPHDLGVLSHYDAVVYYTGDDLIMRDGDEAGFGISDNQHYMNLRLRDYLNDGGKLLQTGKNAGLGEFFGLFYGTNGAPEQACPADASPFADCLPLSNDFHQYWLGAYERNRFGGLDDDSNPFPVIGTARPFEGTGWDLSGDDSANNQGDGTASLIPTSNILPTDEFPQFASQRAAAYESDGAAPYEPLTGDFQMASQQADVSYKRLTKTVDLAGASSSELVFNTSYNTEVDWDYVFVEAHTVGQDDWTTLPDANGNTATDTGQSCPANWRSLHPQLDAYQTLNADGTCTPTGTTGEWHAATGTSDGWEEWRVDLSAYAGQQVEVSITYASDFAVQGLGTFVDDASVIVDGQMVEETSFEEEDLGGWTVPGAPEGSGANANDWIRTGILYEVAAATTTDDTVYFGFGFEAIDGAQNRADVMGRTMDYLLD